MATTISQREQKKTERKADKSPQAESSGEAGKRPWFASTLVLSMIGAVLLYLAFPPVNWWPLAWVAIVPWLLLIRMPNLPGRRPYRVLYGVGFLHWLVLVYWVQLGHWAARFGWIAIALYLACYLPVFVGLSRVAVHRFRVPLVFAAPVIWVGLECLRGWLLTGFSMALLAHTQIHFLPMVQISDLGGAYAVSFVIVTFAVALAGLVPLKWFESGDSKTGETPIQWWPMPVAIALLGMTLAYGYWRLGQERPQTETDPARIALIQGSIDTNFYDPTLNQRMYDQYRELTAQALQQQPDAIVWPESTLPISMVDIDRSGEIQKAPWLPQDDEHFQQEINARQRDFRMVAFTMGFLTEDQHVPLLLGVGTLQLGDHPPRRLNSAVFVDEQGKVAVDEHDRVTSAYHKLHPVMFGEYAPGGKLFPWIYKLMPFPEGLTPGEKPMAFEIAELQMCPSICFENTVPHLIRRQVVELQREGIDPDVLVTLSNDGWFFGSAELDMHLTCGRFRAIELRKPALVAANTGISAHIADDGTLLQEGPRRDTAVVMAEVSPAWRSSLYTRWGDVFANFCLLASVLIAAGGFALRHREKRQSTATSQQPS